MIAMKMSHMNLSVLHIILKSLPKIFIIYRFTKNLFTISLLFLKKHTKIGHFSYLSMFI